MAKKKRKKHKGNVPKPSPRGVSGAASFTAENLPAVREEVASLLAARRHKSALDLAKQLHKAVGTEASEAVLVDAYLARIDGMLAKGMEQEAMSLIDVVWNHYPAARPRTKAYRLRGSAQSGVLGEVLAPLAKPDLAPERRQELDGVIRSNVTDLDAIAACATLPEDHSLRKAAADLRDAFAAVCAGPVEDGVLALRSVSRRSPLAPWKLLIRALAHLYRGEDEACLDYAKRIPDDSAPARLLPTIEALCGAKPVDALREEEKGLFLRVRGATEELRKILERCDAVFLHDEDRDPFPLVRKAVAVCRRHCPSLLERLTQHLAVHLLMGSIPPRVIGKLLGETPRKNAYFWRLAALCEQCQGDACTARRYWEEFRLHARHEGWFQPDSPSEAALLIHMAGIEDDEPSPFSFVPPMDEHYAGQPPEIRAAVGKDKRPKTPFCHDAYDLLARACEIDPCPENFRRWVKWAEDEGSAKERKGVLLEWRKSAPRDPAPLVLLAEAAEQRNALNSALSYLDEAEQREALNPKVRQARFRLWLACALRHIKAKKTHLLRKDITALNGLDQTREGDRPALAAALEWTAARIENDAQGTAHWAEETRRILGDPLGANILLRNLAVAVEKPDEAPAGAVKPSEYKDYGRLIEAVGRAFRLGAEMRLDMGLPPAWRKWLDTALRQRKPKGEALHLRFLAEGALHCRDKQLAYDAAGAGLRLRTGQDARFLCLRSQTLPSYEHFRRNRCLAAAILLARQANDSELIEEAMSAFQEGPRQRKHLPLYQVWDIEEALDMDEGDIATVLRLERKMRNEKTRTDVIREYYASLRSSPPPFPFFDDMDFIADEPDEEEQLGPFASVDDDIIDDILDFVKRLTNSSPGALDSAEFEAYCSAVPHLAEEWDMLKKRYKSAYGRRLDLNQLL